MTMKLGWTWLVLSVLLSSVLGSGNLTTIPITTSGKNRTLSPSASIPRSTPSTPRNISSTIIFASTPTATGASLIIVTQNGTTVPLRSCTLTSLSINTHIHPQPTHAPSTNATHSSVMPTRRRNFCAKYDRAPCEDVFAKSWTQFNESKRYFDSNFGLNGTERFLSIMLQESKKTVTDKRCKWLIDVSLCQYTLAPCNVNGEPISLCREDCECLSKECKTYLDRLIGSAALLQHLKGFDFKHLVLPTNCSVYPAWKPGNGSCVYTGLFDHSKCTSSAGFNRKILWISVGAGSGCFILVISIVVKSCMNHRRKKSKKKLALEKVALNGMKTRIDSSTSMKNRLSHMLDESLLSSKIAEMYDPSRLKQFSLDNIEYISDLGEGQFGLVFKGLAVGIDETEDPFKATNVAVKTLKQDCNESSKDEFNQEVAFMSVLNHPNVVKLLAVATEEEPYCMIFEFMELGDLNQFLRKVKPLDGSSEIPENELCLEDFLSICQQIASGMSYLSSLHFVHRDLATRNCLVDSGLVVKIADFGLARDIYSSDYYKVRGDAMLPVRWMPPEAVLHGKFTVQSDVYSYGVVMWEVFTYALQPYYGYTNDEVIAFAKQGVLLGQPDDCPEHIYKLMLDCWQRPPEKRPNFETIIKRLVKEPPAMSEYSSPKSVSVIVEESGENTNDQPLGKIPVPKPVKLSNHYVYPGAIVNCGFNSDKGEFSKKTGTLSSVGNNSAEDEVQLDRGYQNITVT